MTDFMSYSVREARPQTYFSTSKFTLVGDDEASEMTDMAESADLNELTELTDLATSTESSESTQNGSTTKVPLAISVFMNLRTHILNDLIQYVHDRNEFVIFFDRPEFQGKIYLIPASRSHEWNSSVFKPMQYQPHPSFLEMERVKNKENKVEAFEPLLNTEMFEMFLDGDEMSPPSPTPSSPPSPPSSYKPHIPLDTFISKFQLYYGRKFSCIVPRDVMIEFTPIQKEAKSSEPMIIREGKHDLVTYYLSPLLQFSVHKKSTRERDGF